MNADSSYDLVVFGATGFVGKIICGYLLADTDATRDLKWAIAGRSQTKLDSLKQELGTAATDLPTVIADATDESTLIDLCKQTKVVISTVGPYALYGETLVKVCAETGTDYCDLTGEVQWIQKMIAKYAAIAQQSGARIVHCCGFDSIPSDLGVYFLQQHSKQKFGEPCEQVKMRVKAAQGGFSGGTAASGINLIQEAKGNSELQKMLKDPYILCQTETSDLTHPQTLIPVQVDNAFGEWVTPFVMAAVNTPVVLRSNELLDWEYGKNFQYDEAMLSGTSVSGWLKAEGLKVALNGFGLVAAIAPELLKKMIPASGEGPSLADQTNGFYDLRFWGKTASGQTCMVKVTGDRDPGYGSTAKILSQAGICLAKDYSKTEKTGGFWTPATMFGDKLIQRLTKYAGLTFKVL
ncbi:MAG: saccharopine dehydrogenase NADP-binding domain-containing protein [Limnothrix sp.]